MLALLCIPPLSTQSRKYSHLLPVVLLLFIKRKKKPFLLYDNHIP